MLGHNTKPSSCMWRTFPGAIWGDYQRMQSPSFEEAQGRQDVTYLICCWLRISVLLCWSTKLCLVIFLCLWHFYGCWCNNDESYVCLFSRMMQRNCWIFVWHLSICYPRLVCVLRLSNGVYLIYFILLSDFYCCTQPRNPWYIIFIYAYHMW
jgi:hypothetical protein